MIELAVDLPAGSIRPVITAPDPVLSAICEEVDPADPAVVQLAADLLATMDVSPGCVGLGANRGGVGWRVFCLDVGSHPKTRTCHGRFVLVNPRIEQASRNEKAREGCMSVPDFTGDVKRATRLTVSGRLPISGEMVTFSTDAFEARAIQHEVDHLDGMVFLDRVMSAAAVRRRKVYLD